MAGDLTCMELTLVRNATLLLDFGAGRPTLLVDPMLNPPSAVEPVEDTAPALRNPLVPLPFPATAVVGQADAVLVTHLHNDHFDAAARDLVPAAMPILCQPSDEATLRAHGFQTVEPVGDRRALSGGLVVRRVGARHTLGRHERALGAVSGYVLAAEGCPTVYVAGDCVWCEQLAETVRRFAPDVIVVNAGAARFLTGGAITMTADDVVEVGRSAPDAAVIAVHLEALNHCPMTRNELHRHLVAAGLEHRVAIPANGTTIAI